MKRLFLWVGIPVLAWYISTNWYQLMLIQGRSMYPSYDHMQLVVLNRHDREFCKGDVIAFYCDELSSVLVKRVIAGPEDTAQIVDGTLMINGQVSQVYPERGVFSYSGILEECVKLESKQYLVLGDNITESRDSRYSEVGVVLEAKIYGRICNFH